MMLKITVFLAALSLCAPAIGKIIYVDAGAAGANDGSSWADAYNYLQDALADANMAEKPVEVLVAQGIYKPDQGAETNLGDSSATFQLINGVAIYGGYAGVEVPGSDTRNIEMYGTILSGDLYGNDTDVSSPEDLAYNPARADNSYQVVTGSGTDETAVIDGFTITGGNACVYTNRHGAGLVIERGTPRISNCTFIHNFAQYFGGGIYNYYSSPIIINCTFIQNSADDKGGGIYNYRSSPAITSCSFNDNSADYGGGIHNSHESLVLTDCTFIGSSSRQGGGLYNDDSIATLTNCTFSKNSAEDKGGAIYCYGNYPSLTNCLFTENSAHYGGGGICCHDSDPNITDCEFIENSAHYGGGMYNTGSNPILTNCMLIANSGFTYGGGMYNTHGSLTLNNCIVAANRAYFYGGGLSGNNSDLIVTGCTFTGNSAQNGNSLAFNSVAQRGRSIVGLIDCILWDNGNVIWNNDRSSIVISYSNVRGGWPGEGNIDADPCFAEIGYWADAGDPNVIVDSNDPNAVWIEGDYHLKSQAGRWNPNSQTWVLDDVTSPCIDAGDPAYAVGLEPLPNGDRINMGAHGGTSEASKSP
jgi:predicted outer membrane repeat protein